MESAGRSDRGEVIPWDEFVKRFEEWRTPFKQNYRS
jgi:hypothetical protein